MTDTDRYAEYLICQRRGHQPTAQVLTSIPPKYRCKWCGTTFWNVQPELRESGVPQPPVSATG